MLFLLFLFVSLSFGIGIEEAINTALERNARIKAMEERLRIFEGMEVSVRAFPNPEVGFESGFLTTDKGGKPEGRALYLLELSQPIPLWGVRDKGAKVVEEKREAFRNLLEAEKRRVMGEVYRAFYEALFRKEVVRIWEESYRTAKEVREFVQKAYDLGEVTELELLRAQREERFAKVKEEVAKAKYEASLRDLSRLIVMEVDDVEGKLEDIRDLRKVNTEELPAVLSLRKSIDAVNRQIELERSLAKPSLSAGFVLEDSEGGYYGLRAALSVSVPLFYRRQGEIIQHVAERKALRRRLEGELVSIENTLSSLRTLYGTLRKELEKLEKEIIPKAEEELRLAVKSYTLRAITLLELSDVRRRYYELLLQRAELYRDLHRVYAEFVSIGGWR